MSRPRVFVTQPIAESALARLRAVADVEVNSDSSKVLDKAKLIEGVKRCDILLSLLHDTVDADVLAANPKLMAVSSMNITQDRIDLAAATKLGIPVTNIPAIVTNATADIAFGLLLSAARNIAYGDRLFRGIEATEYHRAAVPDSRSARNLPADERRCPKRPEFADAVPGPCPQRCRLHHCSGRAHAAD